MGMNASVTKLAVLVLPIVVFATAISVATAQTATPSNVVQRQDGMKAMANAAIEIDRQQFDKSANDLGIYALALSVAADRNPDTLGPGTRMQGGEAMMGGPLAKKIDAAREAESMPAEHAFHLMLQTCTSCHAKFRIDTK